MVSRVNIIPTGDNKQDIKKERPLLRNDESAHLNIPHVTSSHAVGRNGIFRRTAGEYLGGIWSEDLQGEFRILLPLIQQETLEMTLSFSFPQFA